MRRQNGITFNEVIDWIKSDDFELEKLPLKIAEACQDKRDYQNFGTFLQRAFRLAAKKERDRALAAKKILEDKIKELTKQEQANASGPTKDGSNHPKTITLEMGQSLKSNNNDDENKDENNKNNDPALQNSHQSTVVSFPKIVSSLLDEYKNKDIAVEAKNDKQQDFPFAYNLYAPNMKPDTGTKPCGEVVVEKEDKVVLVSEEISHFVATIAGIKNSGADKIDLSLADVSEDKRKAFAANAIVAGAIVGIKIENSPYSLEELKEVNSMINHVINLNKKRDEIINMVNDSTNNNAALEAKINETFEYYKQFTQGHIPPKEQLQIFACGVNAAKKDKLRQVATNVLNQHRANTK